VRYPWVMRVVSNNGPQQVDDYDLFTLSGFHDHFLDLKGGLGEMWTTSWRCANCGRVHDRVIEQHRACHGKASKHQKDEVYLGYLGMKSFRRAA
jgi:hypothetical protein